MSAPSIHESGAAHAAIPASDLAIASALADLRTAIDALTGAAAKASERWNTAPAPGRWSPAQIVEHVAITLDEAAKVAAGMSSGFPNLPPFVRPLVRWFFLDPALRKSAIPRGKTTPAFHPDSTQPSFDSGRIRLSRALLDFDRAIRQSEARGGGVESTVFGKVSASRFVRFQSLHARHHMTQLESGR